jgi:hypothetical protein
MYTIGKSKLKKKGSKILVACVCRYILGIEASNKISSVEINKLV